MVFVKKLTFFSFLFLTKKSQKETFFDILDRKECFLDLKSEVLKNAKKWTVCKGVSPWFCQKIDLFLIFFFFTRKSQKETLFDILDRKECFLDLKSELLKNSKKWTFCRGVSPWFLSKNQPFSHMSFFVKKAAKKHFLIFWIEKKRKEYFLDHKRKVLKNCKKSTFCKGVSPWLFQKNRPFSHMFFFSKKSQKET